MDTAVDDTADRRMRAEITAISDCNVANGRQSKAERIDRCRGEDIFFARYKNKSSIFQATWAAKNVSRAGGDNDRQ